MFKRSALEYCACDKQQGSSSLECAMCQQWTGIEQLQFLWLQLKFIELLLFGVLHDEWILLVRLFVTDVYTLCTN